MQKATTTKNCSNCNKAIPPGEEFTDVDLFPTKADSLQKKDFITLIICSDCMDVQLSEFPIVKRVSH